MRFETLTRDPHGALAAIYDRAIDGFERHPQFFRLVHVIERSVDPAVRATYDEFRALTDRTVRGDGGYGSTGVAI